MSAKIIDYWYFCYRSPAPKITQVTIVQCVVRLSSDFHKCKPDTAA